VLKNIYEIMDRNIKPQHRLIALDIQKNMMYFLGEYANLLTNEYPERYNKKSAGTGGDISNGALKAIIMRLSSNALFGPWEMRSVCLEGLGKIAIRSGTAAKVHIYSVIALLAKEPSSCVVAGANSLLTVLDKQLDARARWLPLIKTTDPTTIPDEQLKALYYEHNLLYQQCEVFCILPRSYCPLGAESKPFLKIYWDRNVRNTKEVEVV